MKMTNKAVLAMAIAASLGSISSTQAEIILGNASSTPLLVAEELSLQNVDAFVNDTVSNRLLVKIPTIPGYETNDNNKLFIKLALTDGATFAGATELQCVGSTTDAVLTKVSAALIAANAVAVSAVGNSGAATVTAGILGKVSFTAAVSAVDLLTSGGIGVTTYKAAIVAAAAGGKLNSPLATATSTLAQMVTFKANADSLKATVDLIAVKAASTSDSISLASIAGMSAIYSAQLVTNKLYIAAGVTVLLKQNDPLTISFAAAKAKADVAVSAVQGVSLIAAVTAIAATAGNTSLITALAAAAGTVTLTSTPTTVAQMSTFTAAVTLVNTKMIDITAKINKLNTISGPTPPLAADIKLVVSAQQLVMDAMITSQAASLVAIAASGDIITAELTQNGKKDDKLATFSIAVNKSMDAVLPCVLSIKGTAGPAAATTAYYKLDSDSTNQRMSALVTYNNGLQELQTAYVSEIISFKPTIAVSASLNPIATVLVADAVINVQEAGKKFTNDSKAGGDTLNAFVGSIAFNSLYDDINNKPSFPAKVGLVGLADLVEIADITVSSPSLVGLQNVFLKAKGADCAAGSTTNVGIQAPTGDSSVTFSGVDLTQLEAGVNICIEADGLTAIPAGQFTVSVNGTTLDSSNVLFGEEIELYNLEKNGSTHRVLNIPGSAANGDKAFIRIYNVSNFPGIVLGTLRDQSGAIIGTEGAEIANLKPREVKVISATDLEALFGTWNQRARLELVADVDELRVQALIRSGNVLENMSGQAGN